MSPTPAKATTLAIALVIAAAITSANLGLRTLRLLERIPGRDLTGHFVLFAALSLAASAWLVDPSRPTPWRRARVAAVLAGLVALEELSQVWIPARTFSLADLSASWLGVGAGAAAAALLARRMR